MRAKILIAHGDTQALERAMEELSKAGFEVVATPDGGDAFARFFEERPDLVICSEGLPVLDGRSFGRMIHSQMPALPVVLLAEHPEQVASTEFIVLRDPLSLPEFIQALSAIRPATQSGGGPESESSAQALAPNDEVHQILVHFQSAGNLLALLNPTGMERMARSAVLQNRQGDEQVICEGDRCDGFYLVVDGEVRITLSERNNQEVARLSAGEFFGEMALLSDQPRSASVWTCGPTRLLFFEKDPVLRLLSDYPGLREILGGVAVQRAEENLWQALAGDDDVQRNLSGLLGDTEVNLDEERVESPPTVGSPPELPPLPGVVLAAPPGAPQPLTVPLLDVPMPTPVEVPARQRRHRAAKQLNEGATRGRPKAVAWVALVLLAMVGVAFGLKLGPFAIEAAPEVPALPMQGGGGEMDGGLGALPTNDDGRAPGDGAQELSPAEALSAGDPSRILGDAASQPTETALTPPTVVAPAPVPPPPPNGVTSTTELALERRHLRRQLFDAYKREQYADAIKYGTKLRDEYELDWEATITLAHAERLGGQPDRALTDYVAFIKAYPNYVVTDDAEFFAAELYAAQGKKREARELYRRVLNNPKSDFRTSADERLKALK